MNADTFIKRWQASGAAERANYQLFFSELCELLGVPPPHPQTADPRHNVYVFEKAVPLPHSSTGFIDL
ncbi:MAG: type IIL restriction-modification enzyme MmeI [Chloroflexota bacterium]